MGTTLVIPGNPPPSLNRQERFHWAERRELRAWWAWEAFVAWHQQGQPKFEHPSITFCLYFRDRRKRDRDNYTGAIKPFLDGLKNRAFGDDDSESIDLRPVEILYDRDEQRTEIVIEEAGERSEAG